MSLPSVDISDRIPYALLVEARGWIRDCGGPKRITNAEVVQIVRFHYEGGWPAFKENNRQLLET